MASDRHTATAQKILLALLSDAITSDVNDEACISDEAGCAIIATALANAEREGMKRAAEIAKAMKPVKFNSAVGGGTRAPTAFEAGDAIFSKAGEG